MDRIGAYTGLCWYVLPLSLLSYCCLVLGLYLIVCVVCCVGGGLLSFYSYLKPDFLYLLLLYKMSTIQAGLGISLKNHHLSNKKLRNTSYNGQTLFHPYPSIP